MGFAPGACILRSVARTHIGLVRTVNEDRLLNRPDRGLFAIADGMGGQSRGDVAAEAVIHALASLANAPEPFTDDGLSAIVHGANQLVYGLDPGNLGQSGTTLAGLHLTDEAVFLFWAGDSRIYRLRHGQLRRMTHDHRIVQEMIDAGVLTERTARNHPRASVITRAVGAQPALVLATEHDRAEAGDLYLLCSDGLSDLVDADAIGDMLGLPHGEAADALLDAAIAAGGRDNISLIIVEVGCPRLADGLPRTTVVTDDTRL